MIVISQSAKVAGRAETRIRQLVKEWETRVDAQKKKVPSEAGQGQRKKHAKKAQLVRVDHKVQTTWHGTIYSATVLEVRDNLLHLKYGGCKSQKSWVHVDHVHHHTIPGAAKKIRVVAPVKLKLPKAAQAGFTVLASPRAA